jgi:hypothetical protein
MTSTQSTDLFKAVSFMRKYQKEYFEARRLNQAVSATEALRKAKAFEARVDEMLKELAGEANPNQTELFGR